MKAPRPLLIPLTASALSFALLAGPPGPARGAPPAAALAVPTAVANRMGDFNNDGFADLAISVPYEDVGTPAVPDAGAVNVLYGSAAGLKSANNQYFTEATAGLSPSPNDLFGTGITTGDFDGDGFSDLAVAAPLAAVQALTGAGRVAVFFGSSAGLKTANAQVVTQDMVPGRTVQATAGFGFSLAAEDFDADGFADLVVGTPGQDLRQRADAGSASVFYGSGAGLTGTGANFWTQNSAGIANVAEVDDNFGNTVVTGDFNGDGAGDLVAGVPGEDIETKTSAGAVNVIYGSAGGLTSSGNQFWTQDTPGIVNVSEQGDGFGISLAAGDLNHNGADDLAVGVPAENSTVGMRDTGAVNVIYGRKPDGLSSAGNQIWNRLRPNARANDKFGDALAIGDYNGDGPADLAVGIQGEDPNNSGAVNVIYGTSGGLMQPGRQNWTETQLSSSDGRESGDLFGFTLARGNFDGDCRFDLVVGIPLEAIGALDNAGAVAVIYGNTPRLAPDGNQFWTQNSPSIQGSSQAMDQFGLSAASGP
jgi:hypothetical protein